MERLEKYSIVLINFGETLEGEQSGLRPGLVIQNDRGNYFSGSTIILPLTTKIKKVNQPTHTIIRSSVDTGLDADSMVLGECIRQVSKERIVKHIGKITSLKEKEEVRRVYLANFG